MRIWYFSSFHIRYHDRERRENIVQLLMRVELVAQHEVTPKTLPPAMQKPDEPPVHSHETMQFEDPQNRAGEAHLKHRTAAAAAAGGPPVKKKMTGGRTQVAPSVHGATEEERIPVVQAEGDGVLDQPLPEIARDTPVRDTPARDTQARDTPARDTPARDTPARDTPARDTPARDTPARDTPARDTPAKVSE